MKAPFAAERAREALRLAEAEPERALSLAARTAAQARAERDIEAGAIAERAWGLALRHRGDLDSAIDHLREAVRLGRRAGSPSLAAEARMTMSFALVERGRTARALAAIESALRDLDGTARARALVQRGTIKLELGRYPAAIADYQAALPTIRDAGDLLWQYRILCNRGLAHTYLHEFAPGEADLRAAERLAVKLDLPLSVGFAQANLAFVLGAQGDVPAALDYFDQAERRIRDHGAQVGSLLLDRAELLLSARLVSEARDTAAQALTALAGERREIKLPEVRLLLARAALLDGDATAAARHARRAVHEFTGHRRSEWAALARLAALQAQCAGEQRAGVRVRVVEQVVAALAAADWTAVTEGHLLAAGLLLERGHHFRARVHLEQASRARHGSGPAMLRARAWYAEALLRSSEQDNGGALRAARAGLRVLDRHRLAVGAADLRAHMAGHRGDLAEIGLRVALDSRRARRVFEWAERGRAASLLQQPLRPPEDATLARALADLRATVAEINSTAGGGRDGEKLARLTQHQVALERRVQDRVRQRRGDPAAEPVKPVSVDAVAAALGDRALVEFVHLDGVLHALSIVDGRVRLRRVGSMSLVGDLIDRIPFALHRLIGDRPGAGAGAAALALMRHASGHLDGLLLRPLPEIGDRSLVIVPTGALQSLPWSVLPSCAGRPVVVSPSASLWYRASSRQVRPRARVAVAAGPALRGAEREARSVAAVHGTEPLVGPAATVDAILAGLDGTGLAHLATHGQLSWHNPLFSSLALSDGPLLVYDLETLHQAPHTVVLAACDSARSVVCAGDELLGLSAAFLARGSTQLVASVLPIPDAETAPLMIEFHRLLAAGRLPADALAEAQRCMRSEPAAMAAAAGFVCVGAGFSTPLARQDAMVGAGDVGPAGVPRYDARGR